MNKKLFSTFFMCLVSGALFAQLYTVADHRDSVLQETLNPQISKLLDSKSLDELTLYADSLCEGFADVGNQQAELYKINSIVEFLIDNQKPNQAISILDNSVPVFKAANDTNDMEYAYSMYLYANAHYKLRDFPERLNYMIRANEVWEELDNNEGLLCNSYYSIMVGYLSTGQIENGYEWYQKSQRMALDYKAAKYVFENLVAMGNAINFYEPTLAQELLTAAEEYFDFVLAKNTKPQTYFYIIRGSVCTALNKHREAREIYLKGLEVYHQNKDNNPFFESILNYYLSVSEKHLKNFEASLAYADSSISIVKNKLNGGDYINADVYRNKSEVYYMMNQYDSALHYVDIAYKLQKQKRGNDPFFTMGSYIKKSRILCYAGDYEQSLDVAQEVISLVTNCPVKKNVYQVPAIDSLELKGVKVLAEALFIKIQCLIHIEQDDLSLRNHSVIEHYKLIQNLLDRESYQNILMNSGLLVGIHFNSYSTEMVDFVFNHQKELSDDDLQNVWEALSRTKAYQLTVQKFKMKLSEKDISHLNNQQLIVRHKEIHRIADSISFMQKDPSNEVYFKMKQRYLKLSIELFMETYKLSVRKSFHKEDYFEPFSYDEFVKTLSPEQLYIDYFQKDDRLLIFSIQNGKLALEAKQLPVDFNRQINKCLRSIKSGQKLDHFKNSKLTEVLLGGVLDNRNGVKHLCISPDNNIWKLPFEVLSLNTKVKKLLIEEYAISYSYAPSLSRNSNEGENGDYDLLLMAPGFESEEVVSKNQMAYRNITDIDSINLWDVDKLKPLPYSMDEVKKIERLAKKYDLTYRTFYHQDATKENFIQNFTDGRIVHLSTHGMASKDKPEQSGLFFYKRSDQVSESYLTMNELFQTHSNADLVVLSACQTGYGLILDGEGVMALPRGFIFAGVPNVVCSLWKIHDKKTMKMMQIFYKNLFKGKSYAEALQQAKIEMIKNGELPIDWSAIIQIGIGNNAFSKE